MSASSLSQPDGEGSITRVAPLARHLERPLVVIDAGCRWGPDSIWDPLAPHVELYGFDPDPAECDRLAREESPYPRRFVAAALAAEAGSRTLHLTLEPACSSFYPPDPAVIDESPILEPAREVGATTVEAIRLDHWAEREEVRPDFLKLDTQGSELEILRGATGALGSVWAIESEVEFNPIYRGQPLFGDLDAFLRERGFELWRLSNLVHYGMAGASPDFEVPDVHSSDLLQTEVSGRGGQLYWAHAHWVRRRRDSEWEVDDWQQLLRESCVAAALGFRDLSLSTLRRLLRCAPEPLAGELHRMLGAG